MVDKEKLDLEIRLTAIEYLLINMGKAVYLTAQLPAEKMREMRESARTQLLYRVPLIRTGAPIGAIRWT